VSTAPTQSQLRAATGPGQPDSDVTPTSQGGGSGPDGIELSRTGADAARIAELPPRLRLGTRRSRLARTQSQWVADGLTVALALLGREVEIELVDITTEGDLSARQNTPVTSSSGGTGIFVSALREALLAGRIDLAVHSLKDLPTAPDDALVTAAMPVREDPRDALVARDGLTISELPAGARIGTGSLRRAAQLRALGLGLDVVGVRGNVDTRLQLVADGVMDGVVVARAGLLRLDRDEATEVFDPLLMLPAPGQGALAVECRRDDVPLQLALGLLDDRATRVAVAAERALLAALEAGCSAPVGALADVVEGDGEPHAFELTLRAVVASLDGAISFRRSGAVPLTGPYDPPQLAPGTPVLAGPAAAADVAAAEELGRRVAASMLEEGAAELISSIPPPPEPNTTADMAREGDS
jgi:hydroxymethylbilane synthase